MKKVVDEDGNRKPKIVEKGCGGPSSECSQTLDMLPST